MKKQMKLFVLVVAAVFLLMGKPVYAEEVYYTNGAGVDFTREEYDWFTYLTWDGYQEYVTQEMVDEIHGIDIEDLQVEKVSYCPSPTTQQADINSPRDSTFFATDTKGISMGKYCTAFFCRVFADVEWYAEPNIKSYDVLGALVDGPTRLTAPSSLVTSTDTTTDHETVVYDTDGFGAIVKIPTGQNVHITQNFLYQGTGTIYYSYQHSMYTISLSTAQLFYIDIIGYGNVFDFYGSAIGNYDDMPGVYMTV